MITSSDDNNDTKQVSVLDDCWIKGWELTTDRTGVFTDAMLVVDWCVRKAAKCLANNPHASLITNHSPVFASRHDKQDIQYSYLIGGNDAREVVDQLEILQQDGFLVPNVGELYLLRCCWYSHPFIQKRSRCDKDNLIMITAVDYNRRTCTAILSDGTDNYQANFLSFLDLHIMTKRMEAEEDNAS